jgi:hypothetical protein
VSGGARRGQVAGSLLVALLIVVAAIAVVGARLPTLADHLPEREDLREEEVERLEELRDEIDELLEDLREEERRGSRD